MSSDAFYAQFRQSISEPDKYTSESFNKMNCHTLEPTYLIPKVHQDLKRHAVNITRTYIAFFILHVIMPRFENQFGCEMALQLSTHKLHE